LFGFTMGKTPFRDPETRGPMAQGPKTLPLRKGSPERKKKKFPGKKQVFGGVSQKRMKKKGTWEKRKGKWVVKGELAHPDVGA